MDEEITTTTNNIIPVLIFKFGDNVQTYFLPEAAEAAKDDYLDEK